MAQILRKRPYREHRTVREEAYEEPQTRQRLGPEGASSIRFKSTEAEMQRVQSICDNIVDLLTNLEQIDEACKDGGLSREDQVQVRSYKNELESYIKKYRESKLVFDQAAQRAEIDKFCEKSTALIECLLPPLPAEESDDKEEQKMHDDVLSEASGPKQPLVQKKAATLVVAMPRTSPLQEYIVSMKHSLMKIAVDKLAKLSTDQSTRLVANEESKAASVKQETPGAIQALFFSLMESVRPFLKQSEQRQREHKMQEPVVLVSRKNSIAPQPALSRGDSAMKNLVVNDRAKSVSLGQVASPSATQLLQLKQQHSMQSQKSATDVNPQPPVPKVRSAAVLQAEHERLHAKLWLTLYLLKKFGIDQLNMDANIKLLSPTYAEEQQEELFTLVKQVLRSNPLQRGSTLVRRLAVKVIMQENIEAGTALKITSRLLHDQDYKVREVYIELMRVNLSKLYAQNHQHFDTICTQEQVMQEKNFYVKRLVLQLMVQRCIHLAADPTQQLVSNDAANDLVRVICSEIRAMQKDMRIFCAGLLTQMDQCVPTATVIAMMQKERMFEQKFTAIGPGGATSNFAANPTTSSSLQGASKPGSLGGKPEMSKSGSHQGSMQPAVTLQAQSSMQSMQASTEQSPQVTGILLLMLEDDSMAVRLAGIQAMSCFGKVCSDIRSKCLNFLIDMLNDEINEVRIAALHGIQRFNKVLTLNDYEVEIVLFNLNEDNPRLREEIYLFFGETTVSQGALFTKILNKLFDNLQKFEHQEDTQKIFSLVQKLGKSHSKLVSAIYLKTLNIDKRYLAKEPDQTDIVYVAKMILIYAAAEQMPRILEEAPKFFGKHLNYLKDKYPSYFYRKQDSLVVKGEQRVVFESSLVTSAQAQMLSTIKSCLTREGFRNQGVEKLQIWTRNSLRQVLRALHSEIQATNDPQSSAGRFLEEIRMNQTDQMFGFMFLWVKFVQQAQQAGKTAQQIQVAMRSRLQILSHFAQIPASFDAVVRVFQLRLYCEMLAHSLAISSQAHFNAVTFTQACTLILKLFKQTFAEVELPAPSECLRQIERYIEVNIVGTQSDLKFKERRITMGQALTSLADKITYEALFTVKDSFAETLCREMGQVQFRRIVISSPRDNMTEAFRFSSRHSEFVKLKAEALIATAPSESTVDDYRRYKVVLEYPDKSSSYAMLQVKDTTNSQGEAASDIVRQQRVCNIEQFIELMQDNGWSEAANIEIFITQDFPQVETQILVNLGFSSSMIGNSLRLLKDENGHASGVIPVSNVKKYFIQPV